MSVQLIIREHKGEVRVSMAREGGYGDNPAGKPRPFTQPFSAEDLEDLRWYLEDYLVEPWAVYQDRGEHIEAGLGGMGERLFCAVFGDDEGALMAYGEVRKAKGCELVLQSDAPGFLGLPWELLKAPNETEPMVMALDGMVRTTATERMADTAMPGETLRILMIIARPMGAPDVRYRLIVRELMKRLKAVSGKVELTLLRPPTTEALKQKLIAANEEGKPYQMLHFDGHGIFHEGGGGGVGGALSPLKLQSPAAGGYLSFEKEDGSDDPVPIATVVDLLRIADAEIPLIVLNACRSGTIKQVGAVGPEAGVATGLLRQGAAAVVAMSYSIYAVAAAEFMTAFYEALFRGESVERAMRSGREQMRRHPTRPSRKGPLDLQDWMVPVHYAQKRVAFPHLAKARIERPIDLAEALARVRRQERTKAPEGAHEEGSLEPIGTFFGRDGQFLELERTLRRRHVALIHAVGGMGKTELVKAFAKWLWETRGLDAPPFFYSFEPGIASFGLEGVVTGAGLRFFGPDFAGINAKDRRNVILDALSRHRLLLVLDNFESIRSMPAEHQLTLVLNDEQQQEMRDFLTAISANAKVGALITSRSKEEWLGKEETIHRLELQGLEGEDETDYAGTLVPEEARPKQQQKAYAELVRILAGHPLSMRLILPLLKTEDPAELVSGLKGQGELPPGSEKGEGRLESLGASVHYSFRHLSKVDQERLPALALFEGVADENVLMLLSEEEGAPARFKGIAVPEWEQTLSRCADAGLVSTMGGGLYRIHPVLPGFLTAFWRAEAKEGFEKEREGTTLAAIRAHAAFGTWLNQQIKGGEAALAMALISAERRTLSRTAAEALARGMYDPAQDMLQPLNEFWQARGLTEEQDAWTDQVRDCLESPSGAPPEPDTEAGALWLFMMGAQANRSEAAGRLDQAEEAYLAIQEMLLASGSDQAKRHLPGVYHQLGRVAQERGALDQAEAWYLKSLEIEEALGNRPGLALTYGQLGTVSLSLGAYDKAEDAYTQAQEIFEELRDRPHMATVYHQLGRVAQERGALDQAEAWYLKSLEINEALGNRPGLALTYGQMGLLAEKRGNNQEALEWTVRCVGLFDEFPHPSTGPGPEHLARLTRVLGMPALEAAWPRCHKVPLPESVRQGIGSLE